MIWSKLDYDAAFEAERRIEYPAIAEFESRAGFAIERELLERAGCTLACPVKRNPPNWQHGRVIYAAARQYLQGRSGPHNFLDIGTAKGFSALCMALAAADVGSRETSVTSLDVIDPTQRVARNSVADLTGLKTVREYLSAWPEADSILFLQSTGIDWLMSNESRIHFAFVDGKHTHDAVSREAALLASRQHAGDVVVFDDLQIEGVAQAVANLRGVYDIEYVQAKQDRRYAVGVRR